MLHLNAPSLSTKLSWAEIREGAFFKEAYSEVNDSLLRKLMDDPDRSGMDTHQEMFIFMKKETKGGYAVIEGTLKDAAAFEAFNKKMNESATVAKNGDLNFMKITDEAVATWQGTRFAYIFDASAADAGLNSFGGGGMTERYRIPADSLVTYGKSVYTISGDKSIGSDERFSSLMKEAGDVHVWINSEKYLGDVGNMLGMMKAGDLLKGNISAGTFSFDNGKITMKTKQYLNEQLAKLYKDFPSKPISADVINRIPSNNVTAVMVFNYPPEGLKELIKLTGVDGFVNSYLEEAGYSINDFVKANKGDIVFSLTDLNVTKVTKSLPGAEGEKPFTYETTEPEMKVMFATSVNDKAAFDKMILTLSTQLNKQGMESMGKDVKYKIDNNWFAAGNNEEQIGKFLAGGNNNHAFTSRIAGKNFGAFVDLQKVILAFKTSAKDTDLAQIEASLKMWQDITVVSGAAEKGATTSTFEINLVDKNTNSLKQLNQYFNTMASLQKNRLQAQVTEPATDSVVVIPPPIGK